jgi:hypothetical protein
METIDTVPTLAPALEAFSFTYRGGFDVVIDLL